MLLKFLARITTTATSEDLVGCRHVCSFHNLVGTTGYGGQNMPSPLVGIGLRWLSKLGGDINIWWVLSASLVKIGLRWLPKLCMLIMGPLHYQINLA